MIYRIGPYDAIKLVVKEDGCYSLLVFDKSVGEGSVDHDSPLLASSSILQALNKLSNQSWIVCPGIKDYSLGNNSLGNNNHDINYDPGQRM